MKFDSRSAATVLALVSTILPPTSSAQAQPPTCDEGILIPVSATAQNVQLPKDLNLSSFTIDDRAAFNALATLPTTAVTGQYTIAARYCPPNKVVPERANTLQLLVHGIVYDRNYWSGLEPPQESFNGSAYSWIDYASNEGYPTLSVDRLCYGASSKPNGLLDCQIPLNAETLNQVVEYARAGNINDTKFDKVIYVGHSLGSCIGNYLGQKHPEAVDSYILTGFTQHLAVGALGTVIGAAFLPAVLVQPGRFPGLLDPTYLFGESTQGTRGIIYHASYTEPVFDLDRATEGTTTAGEFATALLGQSAAPGFTGPFLALNDENDQIFCARDPLDPLVGNKGDCGEGDTSYTAMVSKLYPNAKAFQYVNIPATGHSMNYHYTAQQEFKAAHDFLAAQGF